MAIPESIPDGRYRTDLFFFNDKKGKNVTYWVSHIYATLRNLKWN
jgi:hypothetical protein